MAAIEFYSYLQSWLSCTLQYVIYIGWSVKAIVSRILFECLENENVSIVTEKEVQTLSSTNASELLEAVIKSVNECVAEVPWFGFEEPKLVLEH